MSEPFAFGRTAFSRAETPSRQGAFDPDCHYYNDGVSLTITTAPVAVPESGLSVAWLGFWLLGVAWLRRRGGRAS